MPTDTVLTPPKMKTVFHQKTQQPPMLKVLIHNDDYTPAEFVIRVLAEVFRKAGPEADKITYEAHQHGMAVVGTYPKEIAETKVAKANRMAKEEGHPFQMTAEPE
jgi:ATP-dependent Clp protease adaptor protein ClpS